MPFCAYCSSKIQGESLEVLGRSFCDPQCHDNFQTEEQILIDDDLRFE